MGDTPNYKQRLIPLKTKNILTIQCFQKGHQKSVTTVELAQDERRKEFGGINLRAMSGSRGSYGRQRVIASRF